MDLQISVFLLFILFTAGHSLRCYECMSVTGSCAGQTVKTCPSGSSHCLTSTAVVQVGDISSKATIKDCAPACQSVSLNLGISKTTVSCCDTDQCNRQDADPSNVPNGNKCFFCDGKSCSNTLSCSGTEDHCIKATGTFGGQSTVVKGCASKSFCDATASVHNVPNFQDISCCEGNLCNGAQNVTQTSAYNTAQNVTQTSAYNGAQSVSQSFLFFCCSLLSYFLLH